MPMPIFILWIEEQDKFFFEQRLMSRRTENQGGQGKWEHSHVLLRNAISCFQRPRDGYEQTLGPPFRFDLI